MDFKYVIAKCPTCRRAMFYSDTPKDKNTVSLAVAEQNYHGKTVLCPKCKIMLAVIEKASVNKVLT